MFLFVPLFFMKLHFLYLFSFDLTVLPSLKCGVELHLFSLLLDVTVNGELDSVTNGGFSKIIIHFKAGQYLEVTTNEVNLQDGQTLRSITGEDPMSVGR